MPVEPDELHGRVVVRRKAPAKRLLDQPDQQARSNNHVQGVKPGHTKIEREIELGVGVEVRIPREGLLQLFLLPLDHLGSVRGGGILRMIVDVEAVTRNQVVLELLRILDDLDAEKCAAEDQRKNQENRNLRLLAGLRSPHGHGHGKAAGDQHRGIKSAEFQIEGIAADAESDPEDVEVDGVGQEEAAEKQDFGHQEHPHPEGGGFPLLVQGLKLSEQFSGAMHAALLFYSVRAGKVPPNLMQRPNRLREPAPAKAHPASTKYRAGEQNRMVPNPLRE